MDIKETAESMIEEGKAKLDANGDGKVEVKEVIDAFTGRVKETIDAAAEAVDEIKKGFDADADGRVSGEEVLDVVEAATGAVTEALSGMADKVADFVVREK
ncbi:MAG: EF-hand domain-containing protein [Coriobacteriales bacterium]|jgi:Ca2+-binding EF-hand superfamily protein|nr:EF-hand domain-containing protein [Coriobacteriales bacterium]